MPVSYTHLISSMVEALGTLMRETLNTKDKTFTVRRELEIVKSYLTIQQIRFEDRLEYTKQIDDSIMDISLPHLTIQPLVENAINYAMEESTEVCHIQIEGTRSGDYVYICLLYTSCVHSLILLRPLCYTIAISDIFRTQKERAVISRS